MKQISVLTVIGTRPEGLKLAPLVQALEAHPAFKSYVCLTGQHRQMLTPILDFFDLRIDYDLDLMKPNQTLSTITANILTGLDKILCELKPDWVIVQGDTTTAFGAALAAFYLKIPVAHVEAGLRTHNKYSPFPEEINRVCIDNIANLHFAPTSIAAKHLISENHQRTSVYVTGNTIIDTLLISLDKLRKNKTLYDKIKNDFSFLNPDKKIILVTCHRRENHGDAFKSICQALKKCVTRPDIQIIFPVHLNPNIQKAVKEYLSSQPNIHLIEPQNYLHFIYLMQQSYLIMTDSGGIQEEAPSIHKPVLVVRDTTERQEAVDSGAVRLIGTNLDNIVEQVFNLLDSPSDYQAMSQAKNPYGDGTASCQIIEHLLRISHEQ